MPETRRWCLCAGGVAVALEPVAVVGVFAAALRPEAGSIAALRPEAGSIAALRAEAVPGPVPPEAGSIGGRRLEAGLTAVLPL
jgi:hypothetical protein